MAEQSEVRSKLREEYGQHDADCGSPEVQVALLTQRIGHLTQHLRQHGHDHAAQRGMRQLVGKRQRLLRYLARLDRQRYQSLIQRLGLRR